MGHRGEIAENHLSIDILAQHDRDSRLGVEPVLGLHQLAEDHFLFAAVGDLDADGILAGNRREDVDALGAGGAGDVPLQAHNLVHAHALGGINFVARDGGAARDVSRRDGDPKLRQRLDHEFLDSEEFRGVGGPGVRRVRLVEQIQAGQLVVFKMHRILGHKRLHFLLFGRLDFADGRSGVDHLRSRPLGVEHRLRFRLHFQRRFRLGLLGKRQRLDAFAFELPFELARLRLNALALQFQALALVGPRHLPPTVALHQNGDLRGAPVHDDHRMDAGHQDQTRNIEAREQDERAELVKGVLENAFAQPEANHTARPAHVHEVGPIVQQRMRKLQQARARNDKEKTPRQPPHEQGVRLDQLERAKAKKNGGNEEGGCAKKKIENSPHVSARNADEVVRVPVGLAVARQPGTTGDIAGVIRNQCQEEQRARS